MPGAVRFPIVELKFVVCVLNARHLKTPARKFLDQTHGKRRLAGLFPASNTDHRSCRVVVHLVHARTFQV